MTVLHTGRTEAFAAGWENIFTKKRGGKTAKAAPATKSRPVTKASAKGSPAKKRSAKKVSAAKGRKASKK